MKFITIKDDDGNIQPRAFLIKLDEDTKYHVPDMEKATKHDGTLVVVEITELEPFDISSVK